MENKVAEYDRLENQDKYYLPVKLRPDEFEVYVYQFKGIKGDIYELKFWAKETDIFEVALSSGKVICASTDIKDENNTFLKYEGGGLWHWIKKVLKVHEIGVRPIVKRYRYV